MCDTTTLVPIPDHIWQAGAIYKFDPSHPEYGVNEQGEKCLTLDACIVPAIKALWSAGVVTMSCCCGHGDPWGVITIQTESSAGRRGAMIVRVEEYDRLEAEKDALRTALTAARMPHHRNDGDPWFTCPVAWREDHEGYYEGTCFQCDGKPCDHGCNCGADEQNAGIDRALATPMMRREGEADV